MRLLVHDVILLLLGDMSFAQALRPPMEERGGADRARCAWRATQQAAWASSNSSLEAKCRFTSTVLVSGHRCSPAGVRANTAAERASGRGPGLIRIPVCKRESPQIPNTALEGDSTLLFGVRRCNILLPQVNTRLTRHIKHAPSLTPRRSPILRRLTVCSYTIRWQTLSCCIPSRRYCSPRRSPRTCAAPQRPRAVLRRPCRSRSREEVYLFS